MIKFEIGEYKNLIMKDIIDTPTIVTAIDSTKIPKPDDLAYENIFPYIKIPDTTTDTKNYILISVDMNKNNRNNESFNEIVLMFWIMCHKDKMKTSFNQTRLDYISNEIEKLFLDKSKYGFSELKLLYNREKVFDSKYLYREMVFTTNNLRKSG